VSSIHPAETANHSVRGDSISSVDKTADNQSNVIDIAINAAAEAVSGSPDTCQTPEQASQSTGDEGDSTRAPTGNASNPPALCARWPKRRQCGRPKRFLDLIKVSASSPLIGHCNLPHGFGSHGICHLVNACVVIAICKTACCTANQQVSACSMSQVADTDSVVAPPIVEGTDAPTVAAEMPSGMAVTTAAPMEIPQASLLHGDWEREPIARGDDGVVRPALV